MLTSNCCCEQATVRLVGITAGAIIASQLIVRFLNWATEDVGEVRWSSSFGTPKFAFHQPK